MSAGRFRNRPEWVGVFLATLALAGCGPTKPDPTAPTVMVEYRTVDKPVPVYPAIPADLRTPPALATPEILPACDTRAVYGLTREGAEAIVEALGTAGYRLERWAATCAPPNPRPPNKGSTP